MRHSCGIRGSNKVRKIAIVGMSEVLEGVIVALGGRKEGELMWMGCEMCKGEVLSEVMLSRSMEEGIEYMKKNRGALLTVFATEAMDIRLITEKKCQF